jgi:hypothetical protein
MNDEKVRALQEAVVPYSKETTIMTFAGKPKKTTTNV